jgi:hypothetical protein
MVKAWTLLQTSNEEEEDLVFKRDLILQDQTLMVKAWTLLQTSNEGEEDLVFKRDLILQDQTLMVKAWIQPQISSASALVVESVYPNVLLLNDLKD